MRPAVFLISFSLPLLALGCSVPKYQPTPTSYRQAIARGELKEALTSYAAQAREAEQNAESSMFPQYYWQTAAEAYSQAGNAAREAGQLQKAIRYGERAFEMAEKSKDPGSLVRAIDTLVRVYRQVRNFDKAREWIERGIAVVKTLPPNIDDARASWESVLYAQLGNDLVRRREYEKAIDVLSLSVYLQQRYITNARRGGNSILLYMVRSGFLSRIPVLEMLIGARDNYKIRWSSIRCL